MNYYRQSTLLFGLFLPLVVILLMTGGLFYVKGRFKDELAVKEKNLKEYNEVSKKASGMEQQVASQTQHYERWKNLLSEPAATQANKLLLDLGKEFSQKEFQKSSFDSPPGAGGLAAGGPQKSSQIRLSFRGTFRTMQKAFLNMETKLPQLQLQELKLAPVAAGSVDTASSLLNIQVTYTAWEK